MKLRWLRGLKSGLKKMPVKIDVCSTDDGEGCTKFAENSDRIKQTLTSFVARFVCVQVIRQAAEKLIAFGAFGVDEVGGRLGRIIVRHGVRYMRVAI